MNPISFVSPDQSVPVTATNRRTLLKMAAAGALTFSVAGISNVVAQDASKISVGVAYDTPRFDHLRSSTTPWASSLVFENLIIRGDDGEWKPWVAESWEESEDGLIVTFHIREGITFHDGSPLDAEAVKWFFDRARDPEGEHGFSSSYAPITDIVVDDTHTVSFHFSGPFAGFFGTIAGSFAGLISPTSYEQAGEDFGVSVIVGSGPYKVDSWTPNDTMLLSVYEDYAWAPADVAENLGPAIVPNIEVKVLIESATAVATLEAGQIDILFGTSVQDYERLSEGSEFIFGTPPRYGGALLYLSMNMDREIFNDIELRRAFNHAIDKDGIAAAVFRNIAGVKADGYLPPHFAAHYPDAASIGYAFDVDTANSMLDGAGWALTDGVRAKDGTALNLKLIAGNTPEIMAMVQVIQSNLEAIGVVVEVVLNTSTATLEMASAGDYDLYVGRWGYGTPDVLNFFFPSDAANNRSNINDPKLDELLKTATLAPTIEELNAGFMEADKYLIEQAYWVPIVFETDLVAIRSTIEGYSFNQFGDESYSTDWKKS